MSAMIILSRDTTMRELLPSRSGASENRVAAQAVALDDGTVDSQGADGAMTPLNFLCGCTSLTKSLRRIWESNLRGRVKGSGEGVWLDSDLLMKGAIFFLQRHWYRGSCC